MKNHLIKFHQASMQHHIHLAASHGAIAKVHGALADTGEGDAAKHHQTLADLHKAASDHHTAHAEFHQECRKALETGTDIDPVPARLGDRGAGGDLDGPKVSGGKAAPGSPFSRAMGLDQIKPDGVHAVFPSDAGHNNRLVLRSGGVSPNVDLSRIDPEFRHLVTGPED